MTVTSGRNNGPVSDPNIVPLIDVLLVLIIIFMVITPRMWAGLPTLIPQPAKIDTPDARTIVVQVMQGGKLMINQDQSDWSALGPRLADIFKERADKVAFVRGDQEVPFAQVARAIGIMQESGINQVGMITTKLAAKP
jgi:biopolymer transport protein TolR